MPICGLDCIQIGGPVGVFQLGQEFTDGIISRVNKVLLTAAVPLAKEVAASASSIQSGPSSPALTARVADFG